MFSIWDKRLYNYAVEAYDTKFCKEYPLFTNCTKTIEMAEIIAERFVKQGLFFMVVSIQNMKGQNPYYERCEWA